MFDPFTTSYRLQPFDTRWLEIWDGLPIFVEESEKHFWFVYFAIQCYLYQNKLVVSFLLQFLEFHCESHVSFHFDLTAHESFLRVELATHHIDKVLVLNKILSDWSLLKFYWRSCLDLITLTAIWQSPLPFPASKYLIEPEPFFKSTRNSPDAPPSPSFSWNR